jgi:hypothetical protein
VINYLDENWIPQHVTIGLFEVQETKGNAMALQPQGLLEKFGLIHHVLFFVKDEGNNLGSMAMTLKSIVECEPLKMLRMYENTCFGYVMLKACQYATNDDKVLIGLTLVSVKDA